MTTGELGKVGFAFTVRSCPSIVQRKRNVVPSSAFRTALAFVQLAFLSLVILCLECLLLATREVYEQDKGQ